MSKAILFDLDGTLVNSIYDIAAAMNYALESLGQPTFSVEQYYKMVGNGMKNLCRRALAEDKQDLLEELLKRYNARYLAHCCDETKVYDGVPALLRELKSRGYQLALITNKPAPQAKNVMDTLLPGAPLDVVWGQQPPFAVKPDPAVYFHVCSLLGVDPQETLYCGDSDVDILFARNAGAKGIGCLWGFRGEDELKQAGAHFLAAQPLDILNCL
jgi:phosphoglycolate phosphatase